MNTTPTPIMRSGEGMPPGLYKNLGAAKSANALWGRCPLPPEEGHLDSGASLTCAAMGEHRFGLLLLAQQISAQKNRLTPLTWSQLQWCPAPAPPPFPEHPIKKVNLV